MPPKVSSGGWDDDDEDTPLAFVVAPKVQQPPVQQQPPQPKSSSQQGADKETKPSVSKDKKSKEPKKDSGKKKETKVGKEWMEVDKLILKRPRKSKSALDFIKDNLSGILVVLTGVAIVYFKVKSDGVNFAADFRDQENPFQILGVSESSSDADIKKTYRKLSLELHPDKNPDQSEEDKERYTKITKAYKVLSDPEKRRRWMNNENPDFTPLPSDTLTLTDRNWAEHVGSGEGAWLLLAYADWSNECWELAENWEKIGKDLGRYVNVARFNFETEPGLASKFNVMSVPMIYSLVNGRRDTFFGDPSHANVTHFLARSLADSVKVVRDNNGGAFLDDQDSRPKALLFAQQGMVKLRLAFRALAVQFQRRLDLAEVQIVHSDALRALFRVDKEPAIVFVRERDSKPLMYTGKMTQAKLSSLFSQFQYHAVPQLSAGNLVDLCGGGALGSQPCVLYLHDPATSTSAARAAARASLVVAASTELQASLAASPPRTATAFAMADLNVQPALRAALGNRNGASVVALDARAEAFMPYDGEVSDPGALVAWAQMLSMRMDGDFDQLAAPLSLRADPPYWNLTAYLRSSTPQMMSLVAVLATCLLVFACHNLWLDLRDGQRRVRNAKVIGKARAKAMESEKRKLSKWEQIEKQNKEAALRKKQETAERERKREEQAREQTDTKTTVQALPDTKPKPAPKKEKPAPAPAPPDKEPARPAQPSPPAPREATDAELRAAIGAVVAGGDLASLTRRGVREALEARFPEQDLLPRKAFILAEIEAAVLARTP